MPNGYNPLAVVMQYIGKNPAGVTINYYSFGNGTNTNTKNISMYVKPDISETLTSFNLKILFVKKQ